MKSFNEVRLGDILTIRSSSRVLESDYQDNGIPFLRGGELIKLDNKEELKNPLYISEDLYEKLKAKTGVPKKGDLLVTANGSVGYPYLVDLDFNFYFKDAIIWIKQNKKVCNKFIYYVYKSPIILNQILKETFGSTIINYNLNQARKNKLSIPSLEEQTQIATFLDIETSKIDRKIALLEKKVEKLEEYKQSVIFETVTKGLDPTVEMKDSGIDWIGQIPAHWEIKRVKDCILKTISGGTPQANNAAFYGDQGIPWVVIGDLSKSSTILDTEYKLTKKGVLDKNLKIIPKGTLLYSMYASVGYTSILGIDATINQAIIALFVNKKLNNNYLKFSLNAYRPEILKEATGTTQVNLNAEKVKNIKIVHPPLNEQFKMVDYLNNFDIAIKKQIRIITKKIELLKEYKQSLIYEAVTGKNYNNDKIENT